VFGEHNPNAVLGPHDLNDNALELAYDFKPGKLSAYMYLFDDKNEPLTPKSYSSTNFGLRFEGGTDLSKKVRLLYAGEYAKQSDYKDAPSFVDAQYALAGVGVEVGGVTARVGYELLGGDGPTRSKPPSPHCTSSTAGPTVSW